MKVTTRPNSSRQRWFVVIVISVTQVVLAWTDLPAWPSALLAVCLALFALFQWINSTPDPDLSAPSVERDEQAVARMKSLSEHSPNLIARVERNAISYINPLIESYTGLPLDQFLNKQVSETRLDPSVLGQWQNAIREVHQTGAKVTVEMDFPTSLGNRVMQLDAIPEYNEHNEISSVLVVSHDITDRRFAEQEVITRSHRIEDSINYARRIQHALLPSNRILTRCVPDSFVLYKPRDVVSGDFPWFAQVNGQLFVAAVDCTGHGVPGALLSVIGFFLLNDIVRSRQVSDPGQILDLLDEGVTRSLRQGRDEGASRDGMDLSICRIDPTTRQVAYAGAHRPLWVLQQGVLNEIKGDRFSIGGGIFRNQSVFHTHILQLAPGDSLFICSDGFTDQFGGPENRKLGSPRARQWLQGCHGKDR
ncbi:MAG: SpoIIE family protein phosphatase, partial [Cyclobacteriaceae bacterium]|nr:SpoIIE family protein phosphatase [Cyclobacteriaceae bacterium]